MSSNPAILDVADPVLALRTCHAGCVLEDDPFYFKRDEKALGWRDEGSSAWIPLEAVIGYRSSKSDNFLRARATRALHAAYAKQGRTYEPPED